jgi:hypothetical protein
VKVSGVIFNPREIFVEIPKFRFLGFSHCDEDRGEIG